MLPWGIKDLCILDRGTWKWLLLFAVEVLGCSNEGKEEA